MRCVFEHESHESDESLFVSFVQFVFKNNDLRQTTFEVRTKNYELRSWAADTFQLISFSDKVINKVIPNSHRGSIHRVLRKSNKQICQRPLVCAVSMLPHFLVLFFASESEARAKAERRHSVKTNARLAIPRPFSNAKIVRNYDITNFFEQKMSLFPLLKKRGSLWWQKRLSFVKKGM